jgi:hypothetical protein
MPEAVAIPFLQQPGANRTGILAFVRQSAVLAELAAAVFADIAASAPAGVESSKAFAKMRFSGGKPS